MQRLWTGLSSMLLIALLSACSGSGLEVTPATDADADNQPTDAASPVPDSTPEAEPEAEPEPDRTAVEVEPTVEPASEPGSSEPSFEDVAELIDYGWSDLTNVVVTGIEPAGGRWIAPTGTAEVIEDQYREFSREEAADACGVTADQFAAIDVDAVELVAPAGTEVQLALELVVETVEERGADRVEFASSGGFASGSSKGSFAYQTWDWIDLDSIASFSNPVVVGTSEFEAACQQAGA